MNWYAFGAFLTIPVAVVGLIALGEWFERKGDWWANAYGGALFLIAAVLVGLAS